MSDPERSERPFDRAAAVTYLADRCGFAELEIDMILGGGPDDEQETRFGMFQNALSQCELFGGEKGARIFFHAYPVYAPSEAGFALDQFGNFYRKKSGEPVSEVVAFANAKKIIDLWAEDPVGTYEKLLQSYGDGWAERQREQRKHLPTITLPTEPEVTARMLQDLVNGQDVELEVMAGVVRFTEDCPNHLARNN